MTSASEKKFQKLYYNAKSPGSFAGLAKFGQNFPRTQHASLRDWLDTQDAYVRHKSAIRRFPRRHTIAGFKKQFQIDLVDVSSTAKYNDKTTFLLCAIDVFSKLAFVRPLRNKSSISVCEAFKDILKEADYLPLYVHSDRGLEFTNRAFRNLLKKRDIHFFTTLDKDIKCSIVERFNRTLMGKIGRYLTKRGTPPRYIDTLQDVVYSYNRTKHSATGFKPSEIGPKHIEIVWNRLYETPKNLRNLDKKQIAVGCFVRILKEKKKFFKGHKTPWSDEIFVVSKKHKTVPITYSIKDLNDEAVTGGFYREELNPTSDPKLKIDKILDKNDDRYLVKYRGVAGPRWVHDSAIELVEKSKIGFNKKIKK